MDERETLRCSIWDPTGNITALVESPVPVPEQPAVAAGLMRRYPAVEQVGFVRLSDEKTAPAALRMAGGEFCANASMSTAALSALRLGLYEGELTLAVSGAEDAVAHYLQHRAAVLPQRLLVPDALEHEADRVPVELEPLLLRLPQWLQVLLAEVALDYRRGLVPPQVERDYVEEVLVVDASVVVLDHVPPVFHSLPDARSPRDVLVMRHVSPMPFIRN